MILELKLYCKATKIETVWSSHKSRRVNQRNRIEELETALLTRYLSFDKLVKIIRWKNGHKNKASLK